MKSNRKTPIYIALTLIAISIFSFVSLASVKHSIAFLKPEIISPATSNYAGSSPEPTAQPTNLTFSEISSFAYNAAFHHASPQPDGYIVLRSTGQAVIGAPFNGNTYHVGDAIGNARVVYIGSSNEFSPRGVVAGTTFHHNVYSFNGSEGNENYLLSNPLSGQVSTPANMMGDYYEGVNSKREDFVETLQDAIFPSAIVFGRALCIAEEQAVSFSYGGCCCRKYRRQRCCLCCLRRRHNERSDALLCI